MKQHILGYFIFLLLIISCQNHKITSRSVEYFNLAIDTANYNVSNVDYYDSVKKSRLLIANSLLDSSIKYDSQNISSFFWKSSFQIQLNEYNIALNTIENGISSYRNKPNDILIHSYMQRGILNSYLYKSDTKKDFERALDWYEKQLLKEPTNLKAIMGKAEVLCYLDKKESAIEFLRSIDNNKIKSQVDLMLDGIEEFDKNKIFESLNN